ncbi:S8 family serine peptidase [Halorubrum salipaludis]|uniref:S8 family serine peptidase n=1 Tax=Halorubrum salipaludis TaxID=2032630 RepID=UPI001E4187EB|nr:S8 family serine peptidase [Halorubrum salipaludis]
MTAAAVLLSACLIAAAVAPGAVAGGFAADAPGTDGSAAVDSQSSDSAALGAGSSGGDDAVAPGLRSANGTVEVVVRFASDARLGADGGGGGDAGGTGDSATLSANELKTNAASAQADFESFAQGRSAVTVERSFWLANAMLVTVDTDRVPVDRLLDVRGVERVHENFAVELDSAAAAGGADTAVPGALDGAAPTPTPKSVSTTSTDATYGVDMVRAPEVWQEFETRGEGATVAVLDTGVDRDHPDLTVSGWAEYDADGNLVSEGPDNAYDIDGHGTHVAGSVAGGNASGTAIGVAPESELYGVKVLNNSGSGSFAQVVAGMEYATENESVDVIQMSLGADGYIDGFIDPIRNARGAGKVVVASSGNSGQGTSSSPGNVYDSLAVGAVDQNRDVDSRSSGETINTTDAWGSDAPSDWPDEYVVPDVSAPGVNVYSAEPGGVYGYKDGTSMAAPHVSGVAALMLSASTREVSDDELYDTLRETTDHPDDATDPDDRYGTGIVDAYAAVTAVTENRSNLTVTAFDAPGETAPGATVEATATVNNTGDDPGSGTVEYRFNGSVGDEANVSLGPGEEATVSFSYVVPADTETGKTYEHGAYTNDSNLTSAISVVDAPFYEVTNLTAPSIVERNATLDTTANVTNQGVVAGDNRTVELRLTDPENTSDVRVLNATNVSLGAGNATTLSLSGPVPADLTTGATTLAVGSPDDNETGRIRVAEAVGTVNGTVTDAETAETAETLSGIDVVVENGDEVVGETETAADGTYAVDVPAANLTVTGSNETYAPATATANLTGSGDTATADLSLSLRNGTLSGVVGATDGLEPPANATVTVTNETDATVAGVDAGPEGAYAVDLPPGTYAIQADAPGFASANATGVEVDPNATTTRNVELEPFDATLSGTVTAGATDDPIDGATVTVGSDSDATDADGNYSLTLPRGEYDVTASADGYRDVSDPVSLPANGSVEADFALSPAFSVTDLSGPDEIEQGASGEFSATVRNDGGVPADVTVTFTDTATGVQRSATATDVEPGATRSPTFAVSVADDAATGEYDATASTPDGSRTVSFDVVEGESTDGGGGGGGGGVGGGGTGGAPTGGDDEPTDDEPTNETDDGEEPIDEPENGTDDEPTDDEPVDDPSEGDDEADESGDDTDDADAGDGDGSEGATGEDGAEDEAPGFGALVAVLALVALAMLGRRLDGTDR